jgi:hypothetical protein
VRKFEKSFYPPETAAWARLKRAAYALRDGLFSISYLHLPVQLIRLFISCFSWLAQFCAADKGLLERCGGELRIADSPICKSHIYINLSYSTSTQPIMRIASALWENWPHNRIAAGLAGSCARGRNAGPPQGHALWRNLRKARFLAEQKCAQISRASPAQSPHT